jgi:hypothetical protein
MMRINDCYDEKQVIETIAKGLDDFYRSLIAKMDAIDMNTIAKRKNPYLFRAKAMNGASQIIEAIMSAFLSSSEETIFGNVFIEPLAVAASGGQKSIAEGIDVEVDRGDTRYAIAVKSGTSVFNSSSKKKQGDNFMVAGRLAQQAHKVFVPIIGYSYGKKNPSSRGRAQLYQEFAGQDFWAELTGDEEFYLKIIRYMGELPEKYREELDNAYQNACNRLIRDFTARFCNDDGSIDWDALVVFNSGSASDVQYAALVPSEPRNPV